MSTVFGPMRQLGLVVRDFDATLRHWTEEQGIGPFYHFREVPVADFRYYGKALEAPVVSIAFGYSGDVQIEIIHQHNNSPSCYQDFLASGREGLHHISGFFDRPGYDAAYGRALQMGHRVIHEGALGGVRFAYFDTDRLPGSTTCEMSESDMEEIRELFAMIRGAAVDWDGSEPLRPLPMG